MWVQAACELLKPSLPLATVALVAARDLNNIEGARAYGERQTRVGARRSLRLAARAFH